MIALVTIEGAGEDHYYRPYSFMRNLAAQWKDPTSLYIPAGSESTGPRAAQASSAILKWISAGGVQGVILAGYGAGALAAVVAAEQLQKQGVNVDFLALIDCGGGAAATCQIPSNTAVAMHWMSDPHTMSMPSRVRAPLNGPNIFYKSSLNITHWAASGVDYLSLGVPAGPATNLVTEPAPVFQEPITRQTKVTYWQNDRSAETLWHGLQSQVDYRRKCLLTGPELHLGTPPSGQPVGGNPGNGNPPGNGSRLPGDSKPPTRTDYSVIKGDSLSLIAGKFWKDVLLWPAIYDVPVNKTRIGPNPNLIQVGWHLVIPDISSLNNSQRDALRARGRNWR